MREDESLADGCQIRVGDRLPVGCLCAHLRSGFGTSGPEVAVKEGNQALEALPGKGVLREEVCGVHFPKHLPQIHLPGPHGLLDPQRMCVQVPKLPKALPGADAYGR